MGGNHEQSHFMKKREGSFGRIRDGEATLAICGLMENLELPRMVRLGNEQFQVS